MRWIENIRRWQGRRISGRALSVGAIRMFLRQVARTEAREIACDEAYRLLDEYAESVARGEDAGRLMPLVQKHLDLCPDCSEEFSALLRALGAASA